MRITGLATGLDMDQVIKDSMRPYRARIEKEQQNKEVVEIKQKLYRDVIQESRDFYYKHFDMSKSDGMLLTQNWSTVKFESSNTSAVTVTAGNDVKGGNYTITGSKASAAKATVTEGVDKEGDKVVINGKEFTLKGATDKDRATNLNKELQTAGINVTARYTEFAGVEGSQNKKGFIFESTILGADSTFTIGGTTTPLEAGKVVGKDATAATMTGINIDDFKADGGIITIGGKDITLAFSDTLTKEDKVIVLNEALKSEKLSVTADDAGNLTISSTDLGSGFKEPEIKIDGNPVVVSFKAGEDATKSINTISSTDISGKMISINGNSIDLSKAPAGKEVEYINKVLAEQNIDIAASLDGTNIVLTSNKTGVNTGIDVSVIDSTSGNSVPVIAGKPSNIIIKDDKGGVYTHTGNSNTITLDGVTFRINGEIQPDEIIKISGKNDVTQIKDKLVSFINDYNKILQNFNTITTEKRDRSYLPLTDDQKKDMSETEIKLWNERVNRGQLSRDPDITRIANKMKEAMRTTVDGVSGNLEKFGIIPVSDYQGVKNGTFTIDEAKLTAALENDIEGVMKLFIGTPATDKPLTNQEKYNGTGIANRLKTIINDETITASASLLKKAGVEGAPSYTNNELTRSIERHEKKMKDMEKDFKRREQALYSKYARLETTMNNLNSQQSYLASQLG